MLAAMMSELPRAHPALRTSIGTAARNCVERGLAKDQELERLRDGDRRVLRMSGLTAIHRSGEIDAEEPQQKEPLGWKVDCAAPSIGDPSTVIQRTIGPELSEAE